MRQTPRQAEKTPKRPFNTGATCRKATRCHLSANWLAPVQQESRLNKCVCLGSFLSGKYHPNWSLGTADGAKFAQFETLWLAGVGGGGGAAIAKAAAKRLSSPGRPNKRMQSKQTNWSSLPHWFCSLPSLWSLLLVWLAFRRAPGELSRRAGALRKLQHHLRALLSLH